MIGTASCRATPSRTLRVQEEKRVALEEKLIWLKSLPMVMPSDLEDFRPSEYDFLWLMNIIGMGRFSYQPNIIHTEKRLQGPTP